MTLAENFAKKGRREGKKKVISMIRNAERQGLSVDVIAQIAQLDVDSVKKILNNEQIEIPLYLLGDDTK